MIDPKTYTEKYELLEELKEEYELCPSHELMIQIMDLEISIRKEFENSPIWQPNKE